MATIKKPVSVKSVTTKKALWTPEEDAILIAFEGTDKELSAKIGRTVKSIQMRRKRISAKNRPELNSAINSTSGGDFEFKRTTKKIVDLTLGDVFILPNGNRYICNSLVEPEIQDGKLVFEFIGENTVRYICIVPENFGYERKQLRRYNEKELSKLECTFLYNIWSVKVD